MSRDHYRQPPSATKWAKCCGRLYHGSMNRAHWVTCLQCKQPLVYGDEIPAENPAGPEIFQSSTAADVAASA